MTTAAAEPTKTSCELGGHVWDLKFSASAFRALQMTAADPFQLSTEFLGKPLDEGLPEDMQALLVWAGQRAVEPKLKLGRVKLILRNMHPRLRSYLVTWAKADFLTAILGLAEAQMAAAQRAANADDDEESGEGS